MITTRDHYRVRYLRIAVIAAGLSARGVYAEGSVDATAIFDRVRQSACILVALDRQGRQVGLASGVVISADGDVVTNAHVLVRAIAVNV